ncbi:hypothetical protein DH2020_023071 [Rehmannia glutinosa]|uniref:GDSL esterase/lipase n=1 Tax=Rehmannia glutinosa TaxID=99300 RepID=A0ABR0W501_REHGL
MACFLTRKSAILRKVLISSIVLLVILVPRCYAKCAFEAIFNFGDSNSDTGGFYAAFPSQPSPNGMTYFSKPTGRPTDGRLYIDFLGRFQHFSVNQMKQFKAKVEEFKSQEQTNLPQPDIFGKALYTIYIGQHDITYDVAAVGAGGVKQYEPQIASEIANAIKELHRLGGRTFLVLNLAPIGCYAAVLTQVSHDSSDIDPSGCMMSFNNAVREYNSVLKETLQQTRQELHHANVIYVDTHSVLLELYQNPTSHGMQHGITACCGHGGGTYNFNPQVFCGNTKEIDGQRVTASACSDPQNYVSWDGIHLTENANKMMAYAILSGSYFDPPFSLISIVIFNPLVDVIIVIT